MTSRGWERVLDHLKGSVSEQVFQTWIRPLRFVAREGAVLFIATPHKFFKQWIEDNHIDQIEESARKELGEEVSIDIVVGGEEEPLPPPVTRTRFPRISIQSTPQADFPDAGRVLQVLPAPRRISKGTAPLFRSRRRRAPPDARGESGSAGLAPGDGCPVRAIGK